VGRGRLIESYQCFSKISGIPGKTASHDHRFIQYAVKSAHQMRLSL
jgi:hypothetical protein